MTFRLNLNPDPKMLRQFGGLCVLFFGVLALVRHGTRGTDSVALALGVAAGSAGLLAIFSPHLLKPIFVAWSMAAFPVGWLVSHLILGLLFYGVFTPVGLVLRVLQIDNLQLKNRNSPSHWKDRSHPADLRQYFRQY